ncbi:gamma-glutamyl-gamma-aminobutyrate hydrolase family protein [Breoghania sp.]|uniref:gamma-glutamyl-gamma-aminobutyrate hydrolase family protein n=1 Tax=Breoghania sp. TaxID=2065378 RepID=UPI00262E53BE|nr:gamma-glutamyl-gamma-aminobutyrate hydrolase family protein [Breoghania sp.]MDJ0929588.1 gamma-glutamyl-gamma-aminobutyrate hydrolase family protein [Breoghania sp.]
MRISPVQSVNIEALDGLIAGGGDITAEFYGDDLLPDLVPDVRTDPDRDRLETIIVPQAIERGLPVLGICRGSQIINIVLCGTLHQDIYEVYAEAPRLKTVLPRKIVTVHFGTRLSRILDCETCRVNALHHQSVDRFGTGLRVAAEDGHGMIQATEATDGTDLIGVQWHPELMPFRRGQMNLFRWIVTTAAQKRAERNGA